MKLKEFMEQTKLEFKPQCPAIKRLIDHVAYNKEYTSHTDYVVVSKHPHRSYLGNKCSPNSVNGKLKHCPVQEQLLLRYFTELAPREDFYKFKVGDIALSYISYDGYGCDENNPSSYLFYVVEAKGDGFIFESLYTGKTYGQDLNNGLHGSDFYRLGV